MDLGVDRPVPAVVAIDLHRGHLDPAVATLPLAADKAARVVEANRVFFQGCRAAGVPIVHLLTQYRDAAETAMPAWVARARERGNARENGRKHNHAGMPGVAVMPQLLDAKRDWVIDTKKRYDCFIGTELDFVLRSHGINTVLVTGVNTNSCVLTTACAACSRDYAVVVVEDCVDTMDGPALHEAGLACIRTAFGNTAPSAFIVKNNFFQEKR